MLTVLDSAKQPSDIDRLYNALAACEQMEAAFAKADKIANDVYAALPKTATAFIDADPHGLDFHPQRQANKRLKAFLEGQIAREEMDGGAPPANPYARGTLSSGKPFVLEHMRTFHAAWAEGFKTDQECADDAAERQADEAQRDRETPFTRGIA